MKIKNLVRNNIQNLLPYSSARDEFKSRSGLFLDANESPFGVLNRYPDPYQKEVKEKLGLLKNISNENIFLGNGSDEIIDLAIRIFCDPEKDKIIICPPTYGMYEVAANINNIEIINIPTDENFQLKIDEILNTKAKLLFLCSPNNPTGNNLDHLDLLIENFNGIVVLDEAYIDFSSRPSFIKKISQYPNLIISQTLSKAWGKAGIRVGIAYANSEIITYFNKVKPPYNISHLNQTEALRALECIDIFKNNINNIIEQRKWVYNELLTLSFVEKIYPSDANFLLVKIKEAQKVYCHLIDNHIIVRNRSSIINNCLRITIGSSEENLKLINTLKKFTL